MLGRGVCCTLQLCNNEANLVPSKWTGCVIVGRVGLGPDPRGSRAGDQEPPEGYGAKSQKFWEIPFFGGPTLGSPPPPGSCVGLGGGGGHLAPQPAAKAVLMGLFFYIKKSRFGVVEVQPERRLCFFCFSVDKDEKKSFGPKNATPPKKLVPCFLIDWGRARRPCLNESGISILNSSRPCTFQSQGTHVSHSQ